MSRYRSWNNEASSQTAMEMDGAEAFGARSSGKSWQVP